MRSSVRLKTLFAPAVLLALLMLAPASVRAQAPDATAPAAQASPAATQTATITALADVLAQAGTPAAGPAAAGPAAGGDTDLAAMLRKPKAAETAPAAGVSRFRGMSEDQLPNELAAYINNGGGLWYARTVLEKAGVDSLDDLTAEQMIDALENPNKFKQQPAA